MKLRFGSHKNNTGQAVVEFALVLPILLLILFGILEFGLLFNQFLVVTHAAREGARSAALGATNAQVQTLAKAAAATIDRGQLTVSTTPTTRVRGSSVTVSVSNPVLIRTPLISNFFPQNPFPVSGTAIMRVE